MRALAGPAMLLVIVGGFLTVRYMTRDDGPSRDFTELEFADSCYSLSTVLIANRFLSGASRTWTAPRDDAWTLKLDDIVSGHVYLRDMKDYVDMNKIYGQFYSKGPGVRTCLMPNGGAEKGDVRYRASFIAARTR